MNRRSFLFAIPAVPLAAKRMADPAHKPAEQYDFAHNPYPTKKGYKWVVYDAATGRNYRYVTYCDTGTGYVEWLKRDGPRNFVTTGEGVARCYEYAQDLRVEQVRI